MNGLETLPLSAGRQRHHFRVWVPVVLVWLLLLPFAPFILLALVVLWAPGAVDPFRGAAALFRLIASLKGTNIEVEDDRVQFSISFF